MFTKRIRKKELNEPKIKESKLSKLYRKKIKIQYYSSPSTEKRYITKLNICFECHLELQ